MKAALRAAFGNADRAVEYRNRHRVPHADAVMSVVVQEMIDPDVAGLSDQAQRRLRRKLRSDLWADEAIGSINELWGKELLVGVSKLIFCTPTTGFGASSWCVSRCWSPTYLNGPRKSL